MTINLNGLLETMETAKGITGSEGVKEQCNMDLDGEPDMDSFPILVRSMSTSRRHSWGVPVSPINLGRRYSKMVVQNEIIQSKLCCMRTHTHTHTK